MNNEEHYVTAAGLQKIKAELEHLKGPVRLDLAKRLRAAIQQGDLSENADYISTKEEQGFIEGKIQELENIIRNAVIIPEGGSVDKSEVNIGARITVQEGNFPPETYHLVGPKEADPRSGRISHESPIGAALLGRKVGDTVVVSTPGGEIKLSILKIE